LSQPGRAASRHPNGPSPNLKEYPVEASLPTGLRSRASTALTFATLAFSALGATIGLSPANADDPLSGGSIAKHADHYLSARPENEVFGGLPIGRPPLLNIKSGESVAIDAIAPDGSTNSTLDPASFFGLFGVQPNEVLQDVKDFWTSIPTRPAYGGAHPLTGPIYIDGAQPGDTLEVQVLEVHSRVPYGINSTAPTRGVFSTTYPGWRTGDVPVDIPPVPAGAPGGLYPNQRQHLYRTAKVNGREVVLFNNDIQIPTAPFMGVMAVAPATGTFVGPAPGSPPPLSGVQSSNPPGTFGGNFDTKDLKAGSTLYLPVTQPGAQFYTGDGHTAQGGGEVSGGALETSLGGTFRFILHKKQTTTPLAEDKDNYYIMGIDYDLNRSMKLATANVVNFLINEKGLTPAKAQSLASLAVDFKVAEAVDGTQIIEGVIPKSIFLKH
ncbi:MAG: Acetamidase/formamidase, partial [Solirubrobacterales bacterium]|nr:Acetamidase/formamidase [Solirubrobacterales bacterium]